MAKDFNYPDLANVNVYAKVNNTKAYADHVEASRLLIDTFNQDELIGQSTGSAYKNDAGTTFVEIKLSATKTGWALYNNLKVKAVPSSGSKEKAKQELAEWIQNDIIIYKRLLLLSEAYIKITKQYGFTGEIKKYGTMLMYFINRYKARQAELKKLAYAQQVEAEKIGTNYAMKYLYPGMEYMSDAYYDLYYRFTKNNINGLGAIQITIGAALVIAAIIVGTIGAATYLLITNGANDSRYDYKTTSDVDKWLAMLPPDGEKKVREDYDVIIQDAYKKGKLEQKWSDIWGIGKKVLWIGLGAWIILKGIPLLISSNQRNYQKASQPIIINK